MAYKQGVTGTEDYFAVENPVPDPSEAPRRERIGQDPTKPIEICRSLSPGTWGYCREGHDPLGENDVWQALQEAWSQGHNLLLNTGPRPGGAIDEAHQAVVRSVGRRLRDTPLERGRP